MPQNGSARTRNPSHLACHLHTIEVGRQSASDSSGAQSVFRKLVAQPLFPTFSGLGRSCSARALTSMRAAVSACTIEGIRSQVPCARGPSTCSCSRSGKHYYAEKSSDAARIRKYPQLCPNGLPVGRKRYEQKTLRTQQSRLSHYTETKIP